MPDASSIIDERIAQYIETASKLTDTDRQTLAEAGRMLCDCFREGGHVYVCGNGGSAADAQHIAGELVGRFLCERRAFPCVALTVDTSILTAVANDLSAEHIFARQVEAYVRPGDVLWALSTSGASPNIIAAVREARKAGARVLGFTGAAGGPLAEMSDLCFRAPADTSFGIQQIHQLAYHILCELIEKECGQRG